MRLILTLLAVANARWARADVDRAERLMDESDRAMASAYARTAMCDRLLTQARARTA